MSTTEGLQPRYRVVKLSNPAKKVEGIFLEFDDPIAQMGIWAWAQEMRKQGYEQVFQDVISKLDDDFLEFRLPRFDAQFRRHYANSQNK